MSWQLYRCIETLLKIDEKNQHLEKQWHGRDTTINFISDRRRHEWKRCKLKRTNNSWEEKDERQKGFSSSSSSSMWNYIMKWLKRTVRCNANKLNHGMTSWKHASHEDTLRTEHTKVNWKMQADLDNDNSTVKAMAHKLIILFLQHACGCGHVMKSCSNHFFSVYSLFGNALLHCASFATVLTGWSLLLDKLERLYCEAR